MLMLWMVLRTLPRPERQLPLRADRSRLSAPQRSDFITGDVLLLVGLVIGLAYGLDWLL